MLSRNRAAGRHAATSWFWRLNFKGGERTLLRTALAGIQQARFDPRPCAARDGKQPIYWPGIEKNECVPCKNESGLIWNNCCRRDYPINTKSMLPSEVRLELRIWNVRALIRWAGLPLLGQLAMLLPRRFGLLLL